MSHTPTHQTEEQRQATFEAAGLSQEEQTAVESGTAITSEDLQDTGTLDFTAPEEPNIFPVEKLETPTLEATPTETKAQTLTEEIQALTEGVAGKATFEAEQREEFGVGELRTTQEDLVAQIKGFQLQAKSLALQRSLAAERIQQESIGRGRTVGGVAPLTASAQRKITLQQADIASQALTASALLSATEGKLVTARRQVEEAVAQKFAPILEEIEIKRANLDLILQSPDFSREQKNRAQAQKDAIDNQRIEVEDARRREQELGQVLIQAAANGAPATVLEQARRTNDPVAATEIIAQEGFIVAPTAPLTETERVKLDILRIQLTKAGLELSEAQKVANNAVPPGVLQALDDDQRSAYFKLVDKYEANSKDFFKVRDSFTRITASADDPSPAGDVAVVFNFMKMLDPGSVVRESEFALAASTGSLKDAMKNKFGKIATGEILEFTRSDFVNRAAGLFEAALVNQKQLNNTFEDRANKFGIPAGNVTRAIDVANRPTDVEGLTSGELDEIDGILEINSETGLFEEGSLFNLFPDLELN